MFLRPRNLLDLPLINSSDPSFELELHRRRAFFVHHDAQCPDDLEEVEHALNASRASPEPDENDLASFQRRLRNSCNEAAVVQGVMPKLVPIDQLLDREDVLTVPNQQWDKECALPVPAFGQYRIPPPKPDQTVGLAASNFAAFETALAYLSHAARPIRSLPNLTFPLVAIEAKGDRGHNVCRSQSLHNAAVMLHQLLQLWERTGKAEDFYGKSMVCSISITTQTCAITHYWMEPGPNGVVVYGRLFKSWTLNLKESIDLSAIVRCIRNTIDSTLKRGIRLIAERLEALEEKVLSSPSSSCSPRRRKRRLNNGDAVYEMPSSPSTQDDDSPRRKSASVRQTRASSRRTSGSRRSSGSRTSSGSSAA
jgi:hypothetical protein